MTSQKEVDEFKEFVNQMPHIIFHINEYFNKNQIDVCDRILVVAEVLAGYLGSCPAEADEHTIEFLRNSISNYRKIIGKSDGKGLI